MLKTVENNELISRCTGGGIGAGIAIPNARFLASIFTDFSEISHKIPLNYAEKPTIYEIP